MSDNKSATQTPSTESTPTAPTKVEFEIETRKKAHDLCFINLGKHISNNDDSAGDVFAALVEMAKWGYDAGRLTLTTESVSRKVDKNAECIGVIKEHVDGNCPHCDPAGYRIRELEREREQLRSQLNQCIADFKKVNKASIDTHIELNQVKAERDELRGELVRECRLHESLTEKLKLATEALRSLKNEATGFISMADPANHGYTNINCLQNRIDGAEKALKAIEGEGSDEIISKKDE